MDKETYLICDKHKKKQSHSLQINSNCYVCLNRYCPQAYTTLCNSCKLEHRDHLVKILSIEDINFLLNRLIKMPFKQAGAFIFESVQILKKLKLVQQFAKKINEILFQLNEETLQYLNLTEKIISQYAQCKSSALVVSEDLEDINQKSFESFKKKSIKNLSKVDYNAQKDRFEYGSLDIKEKEDNRKKNLAFLRRRIEEVKEYSMKIIEVILNNDESEEQEEDINLKKKQYQILRLEVLTYVKSNSQSRLSQKTEVTQKGQGEKKQTPALAHKETKQIEIQTDNSWIQQIENKQKSLKAQLDGANLYYKKLQNDYKSKINSIQREKESLLRQKDNQRKEKEKSQKVLEQKCQLLNHYEHRLRDNQQKRAARYKQREEVIKQLLEHIQHQRVDSRRSAQKENRTNSKNKKN